MIYKTVSSGFLFRGLLIKKVGISLKFKFLVVLSFLLVTALGCFLVFANHLFRTDKTAYIYENSFIQNESIHERFLSFIDQQKILSASIEFDLLNSGEENLKTKLEYLFREYEELIGVRVFRFNSGSYGLWVKAFADNEISRPIDYQKVIDSNLSLEFVKDYVSVSRHLKDSNLIIELFLSTETISNVYRSDNVFNNVLVGDFGIKLGELGFSPDSLVNFINTLDEALGTKEFKDYLISFHKLKSLNLTSISLIDKEKAFQASSYLENKTIYFALALLGLAIIIGLFFSLSLTGPLNSLHETVRTAADNDFIFTSNVRSSDEIGSLAASFNDMSNKIVVYMKEMQEKQRLDNELKVAKLVQDSFIPGALLKEHYTTISAFYAPASECGGDWWGSFEVGDKTFVMLADATGHGVGAALITASAFNSFSHLKQIVREDESLLNHPELIMSFFNKAFCEMKLDLLMTSFIAVVDNANQKIKFTNASHNIPFIVGYSVDELDKSNLKSLVGANGNRLGYDIKTEYESAEIDFRINETLVLFTDGLLEGKNNEGKEWGKRRFVQSLLDHGKSPIDAFTDGVTGDAFKFFPKDALEDDVTLVALRFNNES